MMRDLDWEGSFNARDLGGLNRSRGGQTKWNAVVRADDLGRLTGRGWNQVVQHGVRTVIDLRNPDERCVGPVDRPSEIETVEIPLDHCEDRYFWEEWERSPAFATPLYYRAHIERFAQRNAEVITAIADAPEGAVAFHCVSGRDRAGQISMLVLSLVNVDVGEIVADYERSRPRLHARYETLGEEDQGALTERFLRGRGTTAAHILRNTLEAMDVERLLGDAGLSTRSLQRLRGRLMPTGWPG